MFEAGGHGRSGGDSGEDGGSRSVEPRVYLISQRLLRLGGHKGRERQREGSGEMHGQGGDDLIVGDCGGSQRARKNVESWEFRGGVWWLRPDTVVKMAGHLFSG